MKMTLIQEATEIMKKMPERNQQVVVDLLRIMSSSVVLQSDVNNRTTFKRTGKSDFNLPPDFDEHFDDANEEIAQMFYGGE